MVDSGNSPCGTSCIHDNDSGRIHENNNYLRPAVTHCIGGNLRGLKEHMAYDLLISFDYARLRMVWEF